MLPSLIRVLQLLILATFLPNLGQAQQSPCSGTDAYSINTRNITHCKKLQSLGAEFGWNYYNTSNITLEIVFAAKPPTPNGWVAWGLNPGKKPVMVGTRALLAFVQVDGTAVVNTYNLTADVKHGCKLESSPIDVKVENMKANYSSETGVITLSARLSLPPYYDVSRINHVWQVGSNVIDGVPQAHARRLENFDSTETFDLASGHSFSSYNKMSLRAAHGILSIIGWGIMLPIGIIVIRYFRKYTFGKEKYTFQLHKIFQISAFIIGLIAWSIGLYLLNESKPHNAFLGHRIIGITIFCLATLQITALRFQVNMSDNYTSYWNIYHHFAGYALLVLIVLNIFRGFAILRPSFQWRWAYIAVLITLSAAAFALEIAVWMKFLWDNLRNALKSIMKPQVKSNGASITPES